MNKSELNTNIRVVDTRSEIDTEAKYAQLDVFSFQALHPQRIQIRTTEFSAVCPGTGLPDIATLTMEYIPGEYCIELKSLKYYLFSWRDEAIFQEPVTDVIFDHLWRKLQPQYLKITMLYNTRGGLDTTTVVEKGNAAAGELDHLAVTVPTPGTAT